MITRSNLAEQLREYQIRSKHDWASVSFFSSTTKLTSSRFSKGGRCGFCNMGTRHISLPCFLCCFVVLQAYETCFYLRLRHLPSAFMHESCEESKTGPEKEKEDASSIINVEFHKVYKLFSTRPQLFM
ncbi:hypothetical protein RHMOL_Rhmol07G0319400 [Rhododendron molle]|uniref:Uncharacterized protein n=1 Tax=Rhododendron molle TaxID=49168 RepID=A0ACC0N6Y5_RHOML|nr:hypothetical protein RHMOL_Rhmol07G0319400 [Rhododendron molle]